VFTGWPKGCRCRHRQNGSTSRSCSQRSTTSDCWHPRCSNPRAAVLPSAEFRISHGCNRIVGWNSPILGFEISGSSGTTELHGTGIFDGCEEQHACYRHCRSRCPRRQAPESDKNLQISCLWTEESATGCQLFH
jgi:hypothetical protein